MSKVLRHQTSSIPHPILRRVKLGAIAGLFFAAFGLLIGGARIGLALLAGRQFPFGARDALLLFSYPVGFIIAGSVVGLLFPIRRHLIGGLLLGVLGAALFYATVMMAWKNPLSWSREDWLVLALCSGSLGPFIGLKFWRDR